MSLEFPPRLGCKHARIMDWPGRPGWKLCPDCPCYWESESETVKQEAMTLRIPKDLHTDLALYSALTGKSANGLVNELLEAFFADTGRKEIERALAEWKRQA